MTVAEGLSKMGLLFCPQQRLVHKNTSITAYQNYGSEKSSQELYLSVLTYLRKECVAKSQQELEDLDDDSTDIFKSNIVEHRGFNKV